MKLAVFNYHYIRPKFPKHGIHGVTPEEFRKQLLYIKSKGYNFLSIEFLNSMILSHKTFDRKYCLITFDDGLKEQITYGLPILKEMNIPTVFFIQKLDAITIKPQFCHIVHHIISEIHKEPEGIYYIGETNRKLAEKHYPYDQKSTAYFKYFFNFLISEERRIEMYHIYKDKLSGLYMSTVNIDASFSDKGYFFGNHVDMRRDEIRKYKWQESLSYHNGFLPTEKQLLQLIKLGYISGFTTEKGFNYNLDHPFFIKRFDANDVYEVL